METKKRIDWKLNSGFSGNFQRNTHVVKDRMEISGARWGINGSKSILKLRSVAKRKDWDEYWEFFTTQAKNNTIFPDEYNLMNVQGKMIA